MTLEIEDRCSTLLRELRRKKGFTLEEFEKFTGGTVKAVVLGSYERGARAISLARLQQLADYYEVPIQYFFNAKEASPPSDDRYTFDLRRIKAREVLDETLAAVKKFIGGVAQSRSDWNGEVISIRRSDNDVLGLLSEVSGEELTQILTLNGFLFGRSANER